MPNQGEQRHGQFLENANTTPFTPFAREIAQHVYFTDHGVIVEDGAPAEFFGNPRKERTRAFLEQVS